MRTAAPVFLVALLIYVGYTKLSSAESVSVGSGQVPGESDLPPELDREEYNARMLALAHVPPATPSAPTAPGPATPGDAPPTPPPPPEPVFTDTVSVSIPKRAWPVRAPYPLAGAILPFHRVVAYYGNFYSRRMGVLGQYPREEVLAKLRAEVQAWEAADPTTPVIPAIQYIAVVAQRGAGKDGMYRLRMPDDQIDRALSMAKELAGVVFLDVQVGKSTLAVELPKLAKYLAMPNVHLAIDPEFSMKFGNAPGTAIGTFDASDVNVAASYLATMVRERHIPPKMLVVHRFTKPMVTNFRNIAPLPEVQIVMDMDGFGLQEHKRATYQKVITSQPVQFAGFKLFYANDRRPPSTGLLTPAQILALMPAPVYIQYQ